MGVCPYAGCWKPLGLGYWVVVVTLPDPPWVVEPAAWPVFGLVITCPVLFFLRMQMYAMVTIKHKPPIPKKIGPTIRQFFRFRSVLSLPSLQKSHQSSSGPQKGFAKFPTKVKIKPTNKKIIVKESRVGKTTFLQDSATLRCPDCPYLWSIKTPVGKARFMLSRYILLQQTVQVVIITSS